MRILIVEDNPRISGFLKKGLGEEGYVVATAANGDEGLDLARQLAKELGVEAEFVTVDWDWSALVKQLNDGKFDVLISTVTITDERREQVAFVEYLRVPLVYVCKKGVTIRSEKDLAGKVVVVQEDTTGHRLVKSLQGKGVPIGKVLVIPGDAPPFDAVSKGPADVTLVDEPVAR